MLNIYIASSFRNIHLVHALMEKYSESALTFYDWTSKSKPLEGASSTEKRTWFDTDTGGEIFSFCKDAAHHTDLVIYLGDSGKDACIELGMAYASNIPIVGLAGSLEDVGLMLNGAVDVWVNTFDELLRGINTLRCHLLKNSFDDTAKNCQECDLFNICNIMRNGRE